MHTVALMRMHLHQLRAWRAVAAAMLAASLLAVAATPTRAAFPGANGPIAFVSDRDSTTAVNDEIYLTDEHGAPAVRLTNHPATDTTPSVSPNGKQIAFASRRDVPEFPNPEGDLELYVMDASDEDGDGNGDHLRRLTDNAATDTTPAWSPGGKKLAFTSTRDGNSEIYVLDADGTGTPTNLTNHPGSDQLPVFSPDGTTLAFATFRDGNFELYLMAADGSAVTNLTRNPANDAWPEFSPDGSRLAFASTREASVAGEIDLWVLHLDGSGTPVNLTDAMVTNERWPAWSPDGSKIAFWSGTGSGLGADAEIYVVNADGTGTPTNLTTNQASDVSPDWGSTPTKKSR
jgi:Tol biopolymer transport system component